MLSRTNRLPAAITIAHLWRDISIKNNSFLDMGTPARKFKGLNDVMIITFFGG
jgi:hypothetical protein